MDIQKLSQATLEATGETFEEVRHGREAPDHAAR